MDDAEIYAEAERIASMTREEFTAELVERARWEAFASMVNGAYVPSAWHGEMPANYMVGAS